ncbi:acyl-CoA dehydratase activase [bacterium]|nr:acyl-CoA dehydratase activase [bacterium]
MLTIGIDVGSITTKAAVVVDGEVKLSKIGSTGYDAKKSARMVFSQVLENLKLSRNDIQGIVSTGYGRNSVSFADKAITEITCHAAGAFYINPDIRSVIDIGGQDSKVILLNEYGRVSDFAMNDKCAAGTGRFLEVMARALEIELEHFGAMSLESQTPSQISSLCTVFAESEVISLIAKGERRENIVAGIHDAIGARVASMAKRVKIVSPVMMTGGVAKNKGLVKALERRLMKKILIAESAQVVGAIGAALLAQ